MREFDALGIVAPDGSQHLSAFRELVFRNWIRRRRAGENHCLQPMSQKQERFKQTDVFAAVSLQKPEAIAMEIERTIGRPGRELLEIIMDDVVGSDDRHFPTELGATPGPIKVGIGKGEICGIQSTALFPSLAPNQEWAGENHIARSPANSVAEAPGGIVRSVQIQSGSEILAEHE